MNKKQLRELFDEKIIDEEEYKNRLFKLETTEKPKRVSKIVESVSEEEFVKIMKAYNSKNKAKIQAKIGFLLAFESGLRINEVLHLEPDDIDTKSRSIKIRFKENWNPKYGKERIVPLPKHWKEDFIKYLPINKTPRSLLRNFKSALRLAGIEEKKYRFHSLRHGFATKSVENNIPLNQVQLMLGHSNVSTTSRYIKAKTEDALKSYEDMF